MRRFVKCACLIVMLILCISFMEVTASATTMGDTIINPGDQIPSDSTVYVAEVAGSNGTAGYATFIAAVDAALPGETVTVLTDVSLTEEVTIDKNITVVGMSKVAMADGAALCISAGTYDADVSAYCAPTCVALPDLNGNFVVGEKPTATVNNLCTQIIPEGGYTNFGNGGNSTKMPLNFVMQFLADQNASDMETSPYADWYGDFVITFTGLANGSFNADGCYLAGHYGDFGWYKIPVADLLETIEADVRYPVMLGVDVGFGQKYEYICSGVADFRCAMYIPPEILEANPDLKVTLELSLVDNSNGGADAAEALVTGKNITKVASLEYDRNDFLHTRTLAKKDQVDKTCTTNGTKAYYQCTCGAKFADEKGEEPVEQLSTLIIPASHDTESVGAKEAISCTEPGNIAHWKCVSCNKLFEDEAATKPLADEKVVINGEHAPGEVAAVAATCTKQGTKAHYKCACGALFSDAEGKQPATAESLATELQPHTLKPVDEVAPTYTTSGTAAHYVCTVCEGKFTDADGVNKAGDLTIPQLIEVVGDKAEVSEGAVDVAIEAAGTTGDVKLDLTHDEVIGEENKPVSSADLPVAALEKVAEADASLTLTKADATVTMDTKALEAVAKQAEGTTVTLVVEEIKTEELTQTQQTAIKEKKVAAVISAELICKETNKPIGTEAAGGFGGGTVTVKIPFTPETGYKGSDYVVIYVADDGTTKEIKTDYKEGCLVVALDHFSDYVVVNTAAENETKPTEPTVPEETTKPTEPTVPEETTKPTEPTVPEETTKPTEPSETTKPGNPAVPDTGDNGIVQPLVMMLVCGIAAICLLVYKKKVLI